MITRTRTVGAVTRSCIKTGRNLRASTSASAQTSRGNAASRVIYDGVAIQANGVSRSRVMWSWSALASLGMASVNSGSALRLAGTSMASTAAISLMAPLILPPGADGARAAGKGSGDEDDKRDGKPRGLLGLRIFGGGDKKDAKVGKGIGGLNKEEEDSVNKMASGLKDALKGFGDDINKAVDGAIQSDSGDEPGLLSDAKKKINEMVEKGMPAQMSFGFIMGVCCGFAAKKTAKAALVGIGLAFGSLQLLSYLGYVELDYDKIEGEVMDALDLDQDGKVNTGDVQELFDRTMKVMAYNLPAGSGFAAGAVVGARMG